MTVIPQVVAALSIDQRLHLCLFGVAVPILHACRPTTTRRVVAARSRGCPRAREYAANTRSGHAIRVSVYMQALTRYGASGPEEMKPVGETAYVAQVTETTVPQVATGIVGHADLRLGTAVRDVLEAHLQASHGRVPGVRDLTT